MKRGKEFAIKNGGEGGNSFFFSFLRVLDYLEEEKV